MSETLATYVDRIRPTFNVNSLAQAAAVAALDDETHVTKSVALNESEKKRLTKALANLGFAVLPSFANFWPFKWAMASKFSRRCCIMALL